MNREASYVDALETALRERIRLAGGWDDACEQAGRLLARTMLREGATPKEAAERLRSVGLLWIEAEGLVRAARRSLKRRRRWLRERAESKLTEPLCPHCLAPLGQFDHFCPKCLGPVTSYASTAPLAQVYSLGWTYRQATAGSPKFVVVLALWLILGLQVLGLVLLVGQQLSELVGGRYRYMTSDGVIRVKGGEVTYAIFMMGVFAGLAAVYAAILWRATARYLRLRREQAEATSPDSE